MAYHGQLDLVDTRDLRNRGIGCVIAHRIQSDPSGHRNGFIVDRDGKRDGDIYRVCACKGVVVFPVDKLGDRDCGESDFSTNAAADDSRAPVPAKHVLRLSHKSAWSKVEVVELAPLR